MCGFAGLVDYSRDLTEAWPVLKAMTETMRNRGPDSEGLWLDRHVGLGHRRLSVIDIAGGQQPMHGQKQPGYPHAVLAYAGEVYNFVELRNELKLLGHQFRTRSDTEVVLHAYLQWGTRCVGRLHGMFAFAVWDSAQEKLILARDRLGIKPLYFAPLSHGVVFASEPKGIFAHPAIVPEVEESSLLTLLDQRLCLPGETPFKGVYSVKPGHVVEVSSKGWNESAYWRITAAPHLDDLSTTVSTVREILEHVVGEQLIADVPISSLLSGGLDSSALTAIAANWLKVHGHGKLTTYSVQFQGDPESFEPTVLRPELDAPYAAMAADYIGTRHIDVTLDPKEVLATRSMATRARDLPSYGPFDTSMYLLFQSMRQHVTVGISGEAADELFGGYPWFHNPSVVAGVGFPWMADGPRLSDCLAPDIRGRLKPRENEYDRYATLRAQVPRLHDDEPLDARMREVLFFSLQGPLTALLDRKDRMSMAVGLEIRVPYCDHRLLEYVWNIPWSMKVADGREKSILRMASADLLPAGVLQRPKNAYPALRAGAYEAEVLEVAKSIVKGTSSPLAPFLDAQRLEEFIAQEHRPMTHVNTAHLVQPLVEIDRWMRMYGIEIR